MRSRSLSYTLVISKKVGLPTPFIRPLPILLPSFNEEEYATLPVEEKDDNAFMAQGNQLARVEGVMAEGAEGAKIEGENLPEE